MSLLDMQEMGRGVVVSHRRHWWWIMVGEEEMYVVVVVDMVGCRGWGWDRQ